jgi:hypothetical protein
MHAKQVFSVFASLNNFKGKVNNKTFYNSNGWHETNAVVDGIIERTTKFPTVDENEMFYSGPHFNVSNPMYKTPRENCRLNRRFSRY